MLKCDKCGSKIPERAIFCPNCGHRILPPLSTPTIPLKSTLLSTSEPPVSKPKSALSVILIPLLLVILIIGVGVVIFLSSSKPCIEDWECDEWSACVNGSQTRICMDLNFCGTQNQVPETSQTCTPSKPVQINDTNGSQVQPGCSAIGAGCANATCCSGYCVHGFCRADMTFCGDVYCEGDESCSTCSYDCGRCPADRELAQNVFTEPIGALKEQEFKNDGYAIVRYFMSNNCKFCVYPVNIENQLRQLALNLSDLFVLIILDSQEYPQEANKYAKFAGDIYIPFIRVEGYKKGVHGYDIMHGYSLGQKLQDGDVTVDVVPLICKHMDYCKFENGKIVRTDLGD